MDLLNVSLIAQLTEAVYEVVGKNKLAYNKENVNRIINSLANVCSTLCALSKIDIEEFISTAKSSHEEFLKSDTLTKIQEKYPLREPQDLPESSPPSTGVMKSSSSEDEYISFSTNLFNLVYEKLIQVMEEKQLLIADMPLLVGCIGSMAAYFSNIYGIKKDVLTNTIDNYYKAMGSYEPDKNLDENVAKLKSSLKLDNPVVDSSSKKKNSYGLN